MSVSDQVIAQKKRKALELLSKNRLTEAKSTYLDLIERDPADAEVWFMLGTVEGRIGNIPAAEKAMGRALEIDATFAEAWLGLGQVLELQGRMEDAVSVYLHALKINPELAEAYASLGRLHLGLSRFQSAADHFRSAINIGLNRPKLMLDYGDALRYSGKRSEALAVFLKLLESYPKDSGLHYRLGNLYVELSDIGRGHAHFLEAIKLDPNSVEARVGEINVLLYQKNFDEALTKIQPLFDKSKDNLPVAMAYARLCHISGAYTKATQRLEQLMSSGLLSVQGQVLASYQLGHLYDAQQKYDEAFQCYQRGNELGKSQYSQAAHHDAIDAIIRNYSKEELATAARADNADTRPVFIVGMPRSGTTLVEQILASHPGVYGAGELLDIPQLLGEVRGGRHDVAQIVNELDRLGASELNRLAARYSSRIDELSSGEKFFTDKLPVNFLNLGFISLLFPHARIIHCRRDPLDTCLSCYFQNFSGNHPYKNRFEDLGHYYKEYLRLMEHWHEVLSLPILDVDYEKLVADQEEQTRRLLDFLDLDWDARCLKFYKSDRVTVTASNAQVQQPIYRGSVGRWKHYEKYLAPLKAALA
jgi:tetratricopeptide (TPR) repeat protein